MGAERLAALDLARLDDVELPIAVGGQRLLLHEIPRRLEHFVLFLDAKNRPRGREASPVAAADDRLDETDRRLAMEVRLALSAQLPQRHRAQHVPADVG